MGRRGLVLAVGIIAVALLLGVVGCTDQTADANKAIDNANVQIKKYTEAGQRLAELMSRAESLPMDATSAKQGIALTDQMKTQLDEQRLAAETAKAEIARIKTMRVRQEFKTYADKEIAVTDALLQQAPVATALIDDMRAVYDLVASGKGTQARVEEIGARIDADAAKLSALEDEAAKREKAASDYYAQQKLGGG
jgi:cytochrome c556